MASACSSTSFGNTSYTPFSCRTAAVSYTHLVQNLTRLAESKGCSITTEKRSDKEFCVTITTENSIGKAEADEQIACTVPAAQKKTVVVISADHMGEGDEELGRILMKGFIFALTQQEHLPVSYTHLDVYKRQAHG